MEIMRKVLEYPAIIWHRISDYIPDIKNNYWISNTSLVFNTDTNKYLNPWKTKYGYYDIELRTVHNTSKIIKFHRLLMMCFRPIIGMHEKEVNHINGDKSCNYLWNLEWCTKQENLKHAVLFGLRKSGEKVITNKYSEELVKQVAYCISMRMNTEDICNKLNLDYHNEHDRHFISNIKTGRTWKNISELYEFPETNRISQIFINDEIRYICKCILENIPYSQILTNMGIFKKDVGERRYSNMLNLISKIKQKKRFTNISKEYF